MGKRFTGVSLALTAFLFGTVLTGLAFRSRLAGFGGWPIDRLDLYRAHTHLAYYGVLFPLAAIASKAAGWWVPSTRMFALYAAATALGFAGFLREGYGPLAIATSTVVLAFWIAFAVKNRVFPIGIRDRWMRAAPLSVLISAALIPAVAVLARRDPAASAQTAKVFLALLMFGVFVPAIRDRGSSFAPPAWAWFPASVLSALHAAGWSAAGAGPVALGALLLRSLARETRAEGGVRADRGGRELSALWAIFALSMILTGLGVLPSSRFLSIAGLHYLILGPLLLEFLRRHADLRISGRVRAPYLATLAVMCAAILLPVPFPSRMLLWQRAAAASGAVLIFLLALMVLRPMTVVIRTSLASPSPRRKSRSFDHP